MKPTNVNFISKKQKDEVVRIIIKNTRINFIDIFKQNNNFINTYKQKIVRSLCALGVRKTAIAIYINESYNFIKNSFTYKF